MMKKIIIIFSLLFSAFAVQAQCLMGSVSGGGTSCSGGTFQITLSAGGSLDPDVVYKLRRNGTNIASAWGHDANDQPLHSITWSQSVAGTYTVIATGNGCSDVLMNGSAIIATTTGSTVSISANSDPNQVCNPATFLLTATGGSTYTWYRQGTPLDWTPHGATFSPEDPGTYYATGVNTCGVTKTSGYISVSFLSVATPTISGTASRCQGSGTDSYSASAGNASSYSWSITPAAGSISSSGVVTWSSAFSGTAVITVTANGCAGSAKTNQYNVSVAPSVSDLTIAGSLSRCIGSGSNTYTATASNASSYSWAVTGSGNTITTSGVVTWNASFTGSAQVTATAYGCGGGSTSQTINVNVYTIPIATLSGGGTACAGATFAITLNGSGYLDPEVLYTLKNGTTDVGSQYGYNSSDQPITSITWNKSEPGIYTVVASGKGCAASVTMNGSAVITNSSQTTISVSTNSDPGQVCNPASFVMTASGGSGYTWYRQGTPLDSTPHGATFSPDNAGTYYVTGVNNCGTAQTSNYVPVTFLSVSTPVISGGVPSRCQASGTTSFSASATNVSSYVWSLTPAAGSISSSGVVTWSSAFSGPAVITVTANGCAGSSQSSQYNVAVTPIVSGLNVTGNLSRCIGSGSDSYTATASNATSSYTWAVTGSGNTISTSGVVTWNASFTGTAQVTATAYGCAGSTTSKTVNVSVYTIPIATLSGGGSACVGTSFTMTLNGSGYLDPEVLYTLKNGTTGVDSQYGYDANDQPITSITWTKSAPGTYTVVASGKGCAASVTMNGSAVITNTSQTSISITANNNPSTVCPGDSFVITASGGSSYTWYRQGTALDSTPHGATFTPDDSGTYYATGVNNCGVTQTSNYVPVTVNLIPSSVVSPTGILKICSTCTQTITAVAGNSYQWIKNEANITGATAATYSTSLPGNYKVKVTSSAGCTSTTPTALQLQLSVNIAPVVTLSANQILTLPTNSTTLTGTASDADGTIQSYLWTKLSGGAATLSGTATPTLTVSGLEFGTYTYQLKVTDNFGEAKSATVTVQLIYPPNNYNYVRESVLRVAGKTTDADLLSLPVEIKNVSTTYIDGLGRAWQSITTQGSPTKKDLVQPSYYDAYGKESKTYLPFVSGTDGSFKASTMDAGGNYIGVALNFYNNGGSDKIADDSRYFSETQFEQSPLNRPLKNYGPGNDWFTNNKAVVNSYLVNQYGTAQGQEKIIAWTTNSSTGMPERLSSLNSGYYPTGALVINSLKDEQGNETRLYSDKFGNLVLKKVYVTGTVTDFITAGNWAETYYIYNNSNKLSFVLQPELSKIIAASATYNPTATDLANLAFQYQYDKRERPVIKQLPGALPVYMVYDNRDRLILTQDGAQRTGATNTIKYWAFTKYDELNRPVLTGIKDTTTTVQLTQAQMQAAVDAHFAKTSSRWGEQYVGNAAGNLHGYTNKAYPVRTGSTSTEIEVNKYLTVTYYDNYTFRSLWQGVYTYLNESLSETANGITYSQPTTESLLVRGQVTGTKTKILDGGTTGAGAWLRSAIYYDSKNRPVQTISDNITGGIDRATSVLDFTDRVLKNKTSHSILWKDLVGVEANQYGLTRTLPGTGWSAGAASVDVLANGAYGWVEVQVAETNKLRMIGFSKENTSTSFESMDYAVDLNQGNYTVFENGINRGDKGIISTGDMIRIERTGSTVKYMKNGVGLYTSTVPSNTSLVADATLNEYGATLARIDFSFKNATLRTITRRFEYDHAGRLIKTWHQVNTQPEILLTSNSYNEVSQLVDKKLHSTVATAANAKQSIDYRYNIRGWLTKINESDIETGKNDASNAGEARDYFGMELGYNSNIGVANPSLYNGNISAVKWSKNQALGTVKENAYTYSYDNLNRITAAAFKERGTSWNAATNNAFSESNYTYDLNGNIKTLTRYDQRGSAAPLDNLTYNYGAGVTLSNRLLKITDAGDANAGFLDGANVATEYTYNDDGSMITDENKGLSTAMTYNYLNLAEVVTRGTSNNVRYIYDATGRKLSQVATYNTAAKRTDYIGEYQYENSTLQFINQEEGRVVLSSEIKAYQNAGDNSTGLTTSTAALTTVTQNTNQTYLKITSAGTSARAGLTAITSFSVVAGERYKVRAKGYRTTNPVYLLIQANGVDLNFPGATLASSLATEAWTEQIVTIPAGASILQAGVIWNTTVATNEVFYLNDFEVIKLNTNATPEYQYMLKDHLGNVRTTFTTKTTKNIITATLEDNTQSVEQNQFTHYSRVTNDLFDHTDAGTTYNKVQLLNGGNNSQVGLTKSLSVMPGDTVKAEVYAKYFATTGAGGNITAFASALLSAFGLPNPAVGELGTASSAINNYGAFIAAGNNPGNNGWPKGFLNVLVFDKNYNLVDLAFQQLDGTYVQTGATKAPHQLLSKELIIKEAGYVYIYVSNEGNVQQDVYFDDFKVTHTQSPVIGTSDYYVGGAFFNNYQRENSLDNKYYYQSKEWLEDLSLNLYDFEWRQYDPFIWRTTVMDPHMENYYSMSPYSWAGNNPAVMIDPDGQDWYQAVDKDGKAVKDGAVFWQKGSDNVEGYKNIGESHTTDYGDYSVTYKQNEAVSTTERVLDNDDYETQKGFPMGCFDFSKKMADKSGAEVLGGWKNGIEMVKLGQHDPITDNSNYESGISYMDQQINKGKSVVVGVDYGGKNTNGDKVTDHFVAISERTTDLETGEKTYRFFDPGNHTQGQGTNKNYVFKMSNGLFKSSWSWKGNKLTTLTHVRKNK